MTTIENKELRVGILRIDTGTLNELEPSITFEACTTQRELRDQGVFDAIQKHLLLPENYTIKAMFLAPNSLTSWEVVIESPELPLLPDTGFINDIPRISPTYCQTRSADGSYEVHIVEMGVTMPRQIIPVSGGTDWLLEALAGDLKRRIGEIKL